jgi:hypothetical protein
LVVASPLWPSRRSRSRPDAGFKRVRLPVCSV